MTARLSAFPALALLCIATSAPAQEASIAATRLGPAPERIMGGSAVSIQEFPWMVSILDETEASRVDGHFCGGTVVGPDWVLTAAHCVDWFTPNQYQYVGIYTGSASLDGGGALFDLAEVHMHPDYLGHNGQRAFHDIALVRTTRPLGIDPITLSDLSLEEIIEQPGLDGTIIGWGLTPPPDVTIGQGDLTIEEMMADRPPSDWGISPQLLGAVVPVQEVQNYCDSRPDSDVICAGYYDAISDVCAGDSGGPLMVGYRGEYVQIGLVSGGPPCYSGGDHYNLYSRVAAYRDWMAQVTNGAVPAPSAQPDDTFEGGAYVAVFDPSYPATMGTVNVTGTMQRTEVQALIGGLYNARDLHDTCRGWISEIPHYALEVAPDVVGWVELELMSDADTTLVMVSPEGDLYCDDDSGEGLNAQITLYAPMPGQWAVYAGSYSEVTDWDSPPTALLEIRQVQ